MLLVFGEAELDDLEILANERGEKTDFVGIAGIDVAVEFCHFCSEFVAIMI